MALKLYSGRAGALKVYASDWKAFAKVLRETDREQASELKKRFKEIAKPIQSSVKQELKTLGSAGPMRGMRHGGRTGWGRNYGSVGSPVSGANRQPYDSVLVDAFNKPKRGQTGIARLRVRSAATTISDVAQKFSGRAYTRMYKIREFGGEEIMRNHILSPKAVNQMLTNLGPISKASKKKKSRNVYPGFDKSYPAAAREAEKAIDKTVRTIEERMNRISK
jgi:hypothetical protein